MDLFNDKPVGIGGTGQFHSAKNGQQYRNVTLDDIRKLVDHPQAVDKSEAEWVIPSTLYSRNFKEQEGNGQFSLLWSDIDNNPPCIEDLAKCYDELGCDYEIYTSRSATEDNQKSRVIIRLNKPLDYFDWQLSQEVLNDWLESKHITPDRANERAAQLCYLPNRGKYYNSISRRDTGPLDPLSVFDADIENKKIQRIEAQRATKERIEASKAKREARQSTGFDSPIDAFNDAYEIEHILRQAGYDQKGNQFRHPKSESGSYSANVMEVDGKCRVHSLSTADPLYTEGKGAHDAFSAFTILHHNGNSDAAIIDAGDSWLKINGDSWNSVKHNEYNEALKEGQFKPRTDIKSPVEILRLYSATGQSEVLSEKMLDDLFVLKGLAILGQWTVFYAAPNTGKTLIILWLLVEQIELGELDPNNVFYVNVDDTYSGGVEKITIAEKAGFHMLLPNVNGFNKNDLLDIVDALVKSDEARGIVIILDTLKKFTDIMDKTGATEFGEKARAFVAAGGSIICLAHTNKHKDADGNSIASGTADIIDDADCAYIIEDLGSTEKDILGIEKQVEFRNKKSRGDVADKAAFTYTAETGAGYLSLFDSVKRLDDEDVAQAKLQKQINDGHKKDKTIISSVKSFIKDGAMGKTELVSNVHDDIAVSRKKIIEVLDRWEGVNLGNGHLWFCEKKEKNQKVYHLHKAY